MLSFYPLNAVIHEKEKSIPRTLLYESYGMQISDERYDWAQNLKTGHVTPTTPIKEYSLLSRFKGEIWSCLRYSVSDFIWATLSEIGLMVEMTDDDDKTKITRKFKPETGIY